MNSVSRIALYSLFFLLFSCLCYGENSTKATWMGYRCIFTQTKGVIECSLADGPTKLYENLEDMVETTGSTQWWIDLLIASLLVCTAGMMSGLTIGLMGLDITTLDILSRSGSDSQKMYSKRILPLLKQHHLLLVTLLLMNALAMEALPVFLERLVAPAFAILISVSLILLFGEIVPQSLCSRYGLAIGGNLCYFVWILVAVCFVIAYPIGKLLDFLIGTEHGTFFKREELKYLIDLHGRSKENEEVLSQNEITIIKGALDLKNKKVTDVMTPVKDIFMINVEKKMNIKLLKKILDSGHSRIPVFQDNREHIVGMLLVKDLILVDPEDAVPVASLELSKLQTVYSNLYLYDMLNIFQQGSHMAIVVDDVDRITQLGIVTLEVIIEELTQNKIKEAEKKHLQSLEESSVDPSSSLNQSFDNSSSNTVNGEEGKQNGKGTKQKVIKRAKSLKQKLAKVLKKEDEITKAPLLSDISEYDESNTPTTDTVTNKPKQASKPHKTKEHILVPIENVEELYDTSFCESHHETLKN